MLRRHLPHRGGIPAQAGVLRGLIWVGRRHRGGKGRATCGEGQKAGSGNSEVRGLPSTAADRVCKQQQQQQHNRYLHLNVTK